ncbi:MAG: hypothetical protein MUF23_02630 [Pirellula sp.]|nr:hypothetical protein [Pirellula sp.]
MDAASFLDIIRSALVSVCLIGNAGFASEDPLKAEWEDSQRVVGRPQPTPTIQTLANWVGRWLMTPTRITTQFAVHEALPVLELEAVIPCGHKICAGGKCYEVEDGEVDGKPCDVKDDPSQPVCEEEPIIEVPAAPPLPPSYQFTRHVPDAPYKSHAHAAMESLDHSQVTLPASVLVSLLVDQARSEARLEMTRELLEERTNYMVKLQEMSEHNARLQTQLAMIEMQQASTSIAGGITHPPMSSRLEGTQVEAPGEPGSNSELQAIHEDLSNIRKQIAILKSNQPVPFAPSYVGSEREANQAWSSPWHLSSPLPSLSRPYVPVSPWPKSQSQAAKPSQTGAK